MYKDKEGTEFNTVHASTVINSSGTKSAIDKVRMVFVDSASEKRRAQNKLADRKNQVMRIVEVVTLYVTNITK